VLGLDHHANITRRMVAHCDAIVGHRTQPHDPFDTGARGCCCASCAARCGQSCAGARSRCCRTRSSS
jgi:microcystin degradation protein MlrC